MQLDSNLQLLARAYWNGFRKKAHHYLGLGRRYRFLAAPINGRSSSADAEKTMLIMINIPMDVFQQLISMTVQQIIDGIRHDASITKGGGLSAVYESPGSLSY